MDGLSSLAPLSADYSPSPLISYKQLVIEQTLVANNDDAASVSLSLLSGAPEIDYQAILNKINERLKVALPEGVESLKPEDATPEATADRIVKGVTALFDVYAKRHPDLEGEELVKGFMETIRSGVQEGYDDAANFLEGIGAFEVDGVKDGIEKTKSLIEEKLKAFEAKKREELDLGNVSGQVSDELVKQAGLKLVA